MTAKQWLARGRWIEREITALMKTRDEIRDRLTHITQSYDGDGAQSTKDPHKFDALLEMEDRLDEMIDKLYQTKNEILAAIDKLEDSRERIALTLYYVQVTDEKKRRMIRWEDIAAEQNYTWRQMMRIKTNAIQNIEEALDGRVETIS